MVGDTDILAMKSRINELEARLEYVYKYLRIEYSDNPDAANKEVLALLVRGNKIEAIKRYREIHNVGLAEGKQAVDGMESRMGL
jgi:ribosomal protein L7/L12